MNRLVSLTLISVPLNLYFMEWIHLHPIVLFFLGHSTINHVSFFSNTLLSSWNCAERFTKKQISKWGY